MQTLLDFIKQHILSDTFIGVSTQNFTDNQTIYVVDYWETTTQPNEDGGSEPTTVKDGKQKMFNI